MSNINLNGYIIGVNKLKHLQDLIKAIIKCGKLTNKINSLEDKVKDKRLTDPREWLKLN